MRGESDGVTERKEQDMAKDQNKSRIAISMFNWGPCVIRLKINEDFQNKLLEEAKQILSSIEADHIKTTETIEQMITTARDRARDEEEKAKKHIEELMKSKLISAEGQVKSSERKIIEEIEQRAIDLSVEKVRVSLSKSLSGDEYERYFTFSIKSVEKGLTETISTK